MSRKLELDIPPRLMGYLRDLRDTGLWGQGVKGVAERLVGEGVAAVRARGIIFPSDLAREARRTAPKKRKP